MNATNRLTILDATPDAREGEFRNDNGEVVQYSTRKQKAKLEIGGFAYPLDVRLDKGQTPYPLGQYVLDLEAMVTVNKGALFLAKYPVLRPAAAPKL